ncbi:MAG: nucleotidyltransferase [Myxococcota bacterium]
MIRKAIDASASLSLMNIEVFPQGSYRNRTNVRADSDVDVCVRCMDTFYSMLPDGVARNDVGIVSSGYTYQAFKDQVGAALVDYFGQGAVTRGSKAFDVHANTYRVDADVVPTLEHRRYVGGASGRYLSGTELRPDNGGRIINWPNQNYENGVAKNGKTAKRFKKVARILKSVRNRMDAEGFESARGVPSYLIECLVWNVPNGYFAHDNYTDEVRACLAYLILNIDTDTKCDDWGEVNELKYLFRSSQPWTRSGAYSFVLDAWTYLGMGQS